MLKRSLTFLFVGLVAVVLCGTGELPVAGAEKISIGKRYQGGAEFTAKPGYVIAQWRLTIDTIVTEQTLFYQGRRGADQVCIKNTIIERNTNRNSEKQVKLDSMLVKMDAKGDIVQKIEKLTFAMRLADESLKYTVLSDWDTKYLDPTVAMQHCSHGHQWINRQQSNCPICTTVLTAGE